MSIAEERGRGTKHAVIVQGLYDRNSGFIGGIVDSRRDDRESIVDVDDVRSFPLHQVEQLTVALLVPNRIAKQDQWVLAGHLLVAGVVQKHLVPMGAQQIGFLGKDLILAAGRSGTNCARRESSSGSDRLFAADGTGNHLLPYTLGQKQIDGSLEERPGKTIGVTAKTDPFSNPPRKP